MEYASMLLFSRLLAQTWTLTSAKQKSADVSYLHKVVMAIITANGCVVIAGAWAVICSGK
jgi:hypothetical protein